MVLPDDGRRMRSPAARRRRGLTSEVADLVGAPPRVALPLQRHPPALVLGASVAEIAGFAGLVATGSLAAMIALLAVSAGLILLVATNTRRVLAFTGQGNVVLSATVTGRPNAVIGPAPRRIPLPRPAGLGARVALGDASWWIDRSAYPALRRATVASEEETRNRP